MMKFESTDVLEFDEALEIVSKEIEKEYPLISKEDIEKAAALTSYVDDKITNDEKFLRYYYLLKIIGINHDEFYHVFNDLFNLYELGLEDKNNIEVMKKIIEYVNGTTDSFPNIKSNIGTQESN